MRPIKYEEIPPVAHSVLLGKVTPNLNAIYGRVLEGVVHILASYHNDPSETELELLSLFETEFLSHIDPLNTNIQIVVGDAEVDYYPLRFFEMFQGDVDRA